MSIQPILHWPVSKFVVKAGSSFWYSILFLVGAALTVRSNSFWFAHECSDVYYYDAACVGSWTYFISSILPISC